MQRNFSGVFWLICIGIVILYGFFITLGGYSPGELVVVSIVVAVLIVLLFIHFTRVRHALDERLELRREVNKLRERRGF